MKKLYWIITIIGSTFFIFTDPVGFTPFLVLSIFFYLIFHHSSDNKDRGKHETPSTIVDSLDKQYSLLFQIVDKKWMLNVIRMGNDAKVLYEDNEKKFQEFGKRIGKEIKSSEAMENKDFFSLSTEDMQTYDTFKLDQLTFGNTKWLADEYIKLFEFVNRNLLAGLSLETAKSGLFAGIKTLKEEYDKKEAVRIEKKILGDVLREGIIDLRKKNPNATIEELMVMKIDPKRLEVKLKEELTKLNESDIKKPQNEL